MNIINLNNFKISIFIQKTHMYIYVYNKNYYFFLKINKELKPYMVNNTTIKFQKAFEMLTIKKINTFIKQFYTYESVKIKFTGKGYKIKKNAKQSMVLLFNRAHTTTIWWRNIFIKKLKKYKIYIKYNQTQNKIIKTILDIRPINIFTKKGLRKARQILYKKKGKK